MNHNFIIRARRVDRAHDTTTSFRGRASVPGRRGRAFSDLDLLGGFSLLGKWRFSLLVDHRLARPQATVLPRLAYFIVAVCRIVVSFVIMRVFGLRLAHVDLGDRPFLTLKLVYRLPHDAIARIEAFGLDFVQGGVHDLLTSQLVL